MRRGLLSLPFFILSLIGALTPLGCGPGEDPGAGRPAPSESEWVWLQSTKRQLDELRVRLAREKSEPLRREVDQLASEFGRRLVDYINADPPVEGQPLGRRQQEAVRMKSDEEMLQARAYVEEGGDYQRAIEIYEAALAIDPGNERLRAALSEVRRMRYMTADRFALAKKGMTAAEVRAVLGQPNLHNVRTYPDRKVVAWFYPKDATGAAAAVWFHREKGAAELTVYMVDFAAVATGAAAPEPAA